jgi:hypothetical protein
MIGLFVLILGAGWLILAGVLARGVARLLAAEGLSAVAAFLLYPLIVIVPFADEIIGQWQFRELCEREAKVWIAPHARGVPAARQTGPEFVKREGLAIPVQEQPIVYVDAESGEPFYTAKAFHTVGGFVMRLGLNMGGTTASCWPEKWTSRENNIDIDGMLKRGEAIVGAQK